MGRDSTERRLSSAPAAPAPDSPEESSLRRKKNRGDLVEDEDGTLGYRARGGPERVADDVRAAWDEAESLEQPERFARRAEVVLGALD